jgi:hypothetical protein
MKHKKWLTATNVFKVIDILPGHIQGQCIERVCHHSYSTGPYVAYNKTQRNGVIYVHIYNTHTHFFFLMQGFTL